ncbi:hypothetical protein [Abyssalbus ytuae]|uniref:Uncharacterized protein n=1 Tax=Abyssalbus ytuae TaxID=2926907 RepID=A0A9E6ZJA0_9FLAO|nr:hypothetical protein [Abyssalbus ytuae]UOB16592.1 hypothetical protein MQE35_12705 [Abyssalbus ytuae]
MIPLSAVFKNIKLSFWIVLSIAIVWFIKDYQHKIEELKREKQNLQSLRRSDSLNYAEQTLSQRELSEYFQYQNNDLEKKLNAANIKLNRIEKVISQKLNYKDTTVSTIKAEGLVLAVKENKPMSVPVIDSNDCLVIKGSIIFDGQEIELKINDRQFKNISEVVTYWERRQWNFLGIKTRIFGKKQATVKIFNSCGKTETYIINKK